MNFALIRTLRISYVKGHILLQNTYNKAKIPPLQRYGEISRMVHSAKYQQSSTTANDHNILVYEGSLRKRIKFVKLLSLSTSMVGVAMLPAVLRDVANINVFMGCALGAMSTFFLTTPLLLHWITKRYVLDLQFDSHTRVFTAQTFNIVAQKTETKFSAEDVHVPDLPGILTSFEVKGKPLFVDSNMIVDPDAYSHMMGYDKPFAFEIQTDAQKQDIKDPPENNKGG